MQTIGVANDVSWWRRMLGGLSGGRMSAEPVPARTTPLGRRSGALAGARSTVPARPFEEPKVAGGAAPDADEPGFMATAGDQLRGSGEGALERVRLKLRSILTPSQPVMEPRAFAGRRNVLGQVIRAVEDQRLHVVLYGSRGMGKTSLLHVLTQRARDARYRVVYGSCGVGTTFSGLFRSLCADIPLRYHPSFRPGFGDNDGGQTLASLLPDGELSARQIADVLGPLVGTRILMIVDEFDRSGSGDFREKVADLIKNLSDRAARVQLVIAGVGTNLAELIEHIPSIQRNIIGIQIPLMSEAEVRHLLQLAQRHAGIAFSDEASDLVVRTARGWPYVASLIAHHAALAAVGHRDVTVGLADAEDAVRQASDEVAGRLGRGILREVAAAESAAGGDCLESAAKAHIALGGEFAARDLDIGEGCTSRLDALVAGDLLLRAREDRFGRTYEFKDVTVPLHLWLTAVTRSLRA
jgi:hypothetical protein